MRTQLQLSCFVGLLLALGSCKSREPDRATVDSLPPVAPQVEPVPEIPPNPVVSVPRPNVSPGAIRSEASRAATRPPAPQPPTDTLIQPAPPRDVRPSIPLDTIR